MATDTRTLSPFTCERAAGFSTHVSHESSTIPTALRPSSVPDDAVTRPRRGLMRQATDQAMFNPKSSPRRVRFGL